MKAFPDRKAVLITVSVFFALTMIISWHMYGRVYGKSMFSMDGSRAWLTVVPLHISFFLTLLYFITAINTVKKSVAYSIAIPFFCCVMIHTTFSAILQILRWKYPCDSFDIRCVVSIFSRPYFGSFSWVMSFFLMLVFGLYLHASKRRQQNLEEQENIPLSPFQKVVIEMRLFRHMRMTLSMLVIYLVFLLIYVKAYQLFWFENVPFYKTYGHFIYVCFLSFMSLFLMAPVIIGRTKNVLVFCAVTPLFWNAFIFVLLAIMLLFFANDRHGVIHEIFSIHFYLERYLKTRVWLISLPLLLVCYIYFRLAKSELARQMEVTASCNNPQTE